MSRLAAWRAMLAFALAAPALDACAGGLRTPAPAAAADCCSAAVLANAVRIAESFRVNAFQNRRFTHEEFWQSVGPLLAANDLRTEPIGRSLLGREVRSVSFGRGPVTVLLWSQMHGDESTATMALADIFRFLAEGGSDPLRARLEERLTVVFVPMLNPDGAELFQRENAAGIDVNRDARNLVTPEARALKSLRDRLHPAFGFNLHDQGARVRVGAGGVQAGLALLAPAYDDSRGYNDVRRRARLVAATLAATLGREIPGRIAKYEDSFNPRAFGDLMQQWGTSTVLIESGALPNDPGKQRVRTLNAAGILLALDAIATGAYASADSADYDRLPYNSGGATDVLVRGGQLVLPGQLPIRADIAINYDDPVAHSGSGQIRDVGDLQGATSTDTIDATGLFIHPRGDALTTRGAGTWLRIGAPASLDLRRGADTTSVIVRQLGEPAPPTRP